MIKFEIFNYQTSKICHLINDTSQEIHRISPKSITWNSKGNFYKLIPSQPATAIIIGKDYLLLQYREKSEEYPHPHNMVMYNFNAVVEYVVEAPFLKTNEVSFNYKNLQASFDGFTRLDRKDDNSPHEILIDNQRHVLVSLYDNKHGTPLDDRAGKHHELQALNVETGEFHPTWCKYYGRL